MTPENTNKNNPNTSPKTSNNLNWFVALILVVCVALNTLSTYVIVKWVQVPWLNSFWIKQELLNLEYEKVGGKENYDIISKMQKTQIEQYVAQYKQQNWWDKWTEWSTKTENIKTEVKTLTQDEIKAIKEWAYIEGNKDAKITIVEYSDLECPYCIRQATQWVIEWVKVKYEWKINSIFKNFRWVPHENSEAETVASLCVWKLGWVEKYAKYYKEIFSRSKWWNGTWFGKDALAPLAKEIWVNENEFVSCYDKQYQDMVKIFDKDTAEGKKLWVEWTPWSIIINNETGKFFLIAWAYPQSEFEAKVDELLK